MFWCFKISHKVIGELEIQEEGQSSRVLVKVGVVYVWVWISVMLRGEIM